MSHGVIATLPELIKLEQVARGRPPRIRAKAARSGDQASLLRGRGMDFTDYLNKRGCLNKRFELSIR